MAYNYLPKCWLTISACYWMDTYCSSVFRCRTTPNYYLMNSHIFAVGKYSQSGMYEYYKILKK